MSASSSAQVSLLISNVPSSHAQFIAKNLIESRVAACVTLSPVQSVYRWDNQICIDEEVTLTAKVSQSSLEQCMTRIKDLHPYDLPEVLCLPIDEQYSYPPYLAWVQEECMSKNSLK